MVNVEKLRAILRTVYDEGEVNQWLRSPQPQLGGEIPEQVILAGGLERVELIAQQLADGVFI